MTLESLIVASDTEPKWRRRKIARPAEIIEAALIEFSEKGYAYARLEEIARRAGISKAALYRWDLATWGQPDVSPSAIVDNITAVNAKRETVR